MAIVAISCLSAALRRFAGQWLRGTAIAPGRGIQAVSGNGSRRISVRTGPAGRLVIGGDLLVPWQRPALFRDAGPPPADPEIGGLAVLTADVE
jgi:hypothetical protein